MRWYSQHLVTTLVRRYTRDNQVATVRIMRMDEPEIDTYDGENLEAVAAGVVYSGRGRVYSVSGPVQYLLGDEPQYFSSAMVSVPDTHESDADDGTYLIGDPVLPRVDDIVEVLAHPVDVRLTNQKFRVTDVAHGGQFNAFVVMSCIGVQFSKRWSHPGEDDVDLTIPPEWIVP